MNDLDLYRASRLRARRALVLGTGLAAAGLLLMARSAFAQDAVPVPAQAAGDPMMDALVTVAKHFGGAVRAGEAFAAVVLGVVLLVLALRVFGKRLHDAIPDDTKNPVLRFVEVVLGFLFDSKPGGLLLSGLSSAAASVGAIAASGTALTPAVVGVAAIGAGGVVGLASALYGWGKDLYGWWAARKPDPAPAQAAGVAAAKDPGPTLNG